MFKCPFLFLLLFAVAGLAQNAAVEKSIQFTPSEAESMLFLYNQTMVKGTDVEIVAPLGKKLNDGLKRARALTDTTETIELKLKLVELDLCMSIIKNSTFEAKYAALVLGMKRKIEKLLPPPPVEEKTAPAKQQK